MTGEVNGIARGVENVSENRLIDVGRADSRAFDGALRSVNGEIDGGESPELSAESAERCSNGGEEDYSLRLRVSAHRSSARAVTPSSRNSRKTSKPDRAPLRTHRSVSRRGSVRSAGSRSRYGLEVKCLRRICILPPPPWISPARRTM